MEILRQINFESGLGADRWISTGFKNAFEQLGHNCHFLSYNQDLADRISEIEPDIIMISQDRITEKNLPILLSQKKEGKKVFLWVDSMLLENKNLVDLIKKHDPASFYYGETEPEWMEDFTKTTGKPYVLIPNAANSMLHFPVEPVKKYECDIAYLGTNLPLKRDAFRRLLFPLKKNYRVRIYGPDWTVTDNAMRIIGVAARKMDLTKLNNMIAKARMSVPPEEERQLYSSAKISLNIHESRSGRTSNHVILNERTFKIPACGGFEICDFIPGGVLQRYFSENEVVMAEDDQDWFAKIQHYFHHDDERTGIKLAGTRKALREHTYLSRVQTVINISAS